MKVIRCKNYDEASKIASDILIQQIKEKPNCILGLATGSSPIGTYQKLIEAYQQNIISFKDVQTYNLDEYIGISRQNNQSYYYFMHDHLFHHVDILESNIHIPYAQKNHEEEACKYYSDALNANQVDIQLLGIGANGHIGFNEPGTSFDQETFIVTLTEKTRKDNQRFFSSLDEVPTQAITMGIKNIMNAKKIVLIATGEGKKEAVKRLLSNDISKDFPASALHLHSDVIVIVDEAAAAFI